MTVFLQATVKVPSAIAPATAPPVVSSIPQSVPTAKSVTRAIDESDMLDRLGLGAFADTIVMSVLAVVLGIIVVGVIFWAVRKAFGSTDDAIKVYNNAEQITFDLSTRKRSAELYNASARLQIESVRLSMRP